MALADDLIAAWELDEASGTRVDSHGSNDLSDNNTVGSGTGLVLGTAADFERDNNESLSLADNTDLSLGSDTAFTFEVWVKAESFEFSANSGMVINKGNVNGSGDEYLLWYGSSGGMEIAGWQLYVGNGSSSATVVGAPGSVTTGTWYQIIVWHDPTANEIGIAVNAGTAVTASWSGGTQDTSHAFAIGNRSSGSGNGFDGLIGPARFWKGRALSGAERTELYNSGSGRTYSYITGGGAGKVTKNTRARPLGKFLGMRRFLSKLGK